MENAHCIPPSSICVLQFQIGRPSVIWCVTYENVISAMHKTRFVSLLLDAAHHKHARCAFLYLCSGNLLLHFGFGSRGINSFFLLMDCCVNRTKNITGMSLQDNYELFFGTGIFIRKTWYMLLIEWMFLNLST